MSNNLLDRSVKKKKKTVN